MSSEQFRLSQDLLETYKDYKKCTSKVVEWMASVSSTSTKTATDRTTWTLAQIRGIADEIFHKGIKMPDDIKYYFKFAIENRTQISGQYQKGNNSESAALSNSRHEAFTESLSGAFRRICGHAFNEENKFSVKPVTPATGTNNSGNVFEALQELKIPEHTPIDTTSQDSEDKVIAAAEETTAMPTSEPQFELLDDDFDMLFKAWETVSALQLLTTFSKHYWIDVRLGKMPMMVAAWLTLAAYTQTDYTGYSAAKVKKWTRGMKENDPTFQRLTENDHLQLMDWYNRFELLVDPLIRALLFTGFPRPGLSTTPTVIMRVKGQQIDPSALRNGKNEVLNPSRFFKWLPGGKVEREQDDKCMESMIKSMLKEHLLQTAHTNEDSKTKKENKRKADFINQIHPLVRECGSFVFDAQKPHTPTSAVLGVHLLVESFKSYLGNDTLKSPPSNMLNPRVVCLKFGANIRKSVRRVFEIMPPLNSLYCHIEGCKDADLLFGMRSFRDDVSEFLSQRRLDLYGQSPLTCGLQMCGFLRSATEFGLDLCNSGTTVATLLHFYNAARKLDIIPEEPILLEPLLKVLIEPVFKGSLPRKQFYKQYKLFTGARLTFDVAKTRKVWNPEGEEEESADAQKVPKDKKRCWRLSDPDSTLENQLKGAEISVFDGLQLNHFNPASKAASPAWCKLFNLPKGSEYFHSRPQVAVPFRRAYHKHHTFTDILGIMERQAMAEFAGDFPVAKINWLEVYLACTKILHIMGEFQLTDAGTDPKEFSEMYEAGGFDVVKVSRGLCQGTLSIMDNGCTTEGCKIGGTRAHLNRATFAYTKALMQTLKGLKTSDFLWDV